MRYKISAPAPGEEDPNIQLVRAIEARDLETARAALERGASPNTTEGKYARPVLWVAARADEADMVGLLLDAGAMYAAPQHSESTGDLFHDALRYNNSLVALMLLDRGVDVQEEVEGLTALLRTAWSNHTRLVAPLLRAGADPDARDARGRGAVELATRDHTIEELLRHGVRPARVAPDEEAPGPLVVAARADNVTLLRRLLALGVDVHAGYPDTPLHLAVERSLPGIAEALLEHGADPAHPGRAGTPLGIAATRGLVGLAEALIPKASDEALGHALCDACYENQTGIVSALLGARAPVDARSHVNHLDRPLHLAARHDNPAILNALLDQGADPNTRGVNDRTPLWVAASYGATRAVESLLRAGADRDATDTSGLDPYEIAHEHNHFGVMAVLRDHGAKSMKARQEELEGPPPLELEVDGWAAHAKFGAGQVVAMRGDGEKRKVTIRFDSGERTLLARFLTPCPAPGA